MYPILWLNPYEFINSIKYMGDYFNDICTLTLVTVWTPNLPSSYFFIWLFFKLPILIILGVIIFPLVEKKFSKIILIQFIMELLFSVSGIIFIFILFSKYL